MFYIANINVLRGWVFFPLSFVWKCFLNVWKNNAAKPQRDKKQQKKRNTYLIFFISFTSFYAPMVFFCLIQTYLYQIKVKKISVNAIYLNWRRNPSFPSFGGLLISFTFRFLRIRKYFWSFTKCNAWSTCISTS